MTTHSSFDGTIRSDADAQQVRTALVAVADARRSWQAELADIHGELSIPCLIGAGWAVLAEIITDGIPLTLVLGRWSSPKGFPTYDPNGQVGLVSLDILHRFCGISLYPPESVKRVVRDVQANLLDDDKIELVRVYARHINDLKRDRIAKLEEMVRSMDEAYAAGKARLEDWAAQLKMAQN